jgi:hypothetical protein
MESTEPLEDGRTLLYDHGLWVRTHRVRAASHGQLSINSASNGWLRGICASGILLGAWPCANADPEKDTGPSRWYESVLKALDPLQTAAIETA